MLVETVVLPLGLGPLSGAPPLTVITWGGASGPEPGEHPGPGVGCPAPLTM